MSSEHTNTSKYDTLKSITEETWKRILLNLPYIYKTKGTVRGLQSLITCYGISKNILRIIEYGGPDVSESVESNYKFDNFTYVIPFTATQSIETFWTASYLDRFPSTIQVRFSVTGSDYTRANSMSIVEVPGSWSLQVMPTSDDKGKIKFNLFTGNLVNNFINGLALPYATFSSNQNNIDVAINNPGAGFYIGCASNNLGYVNVGDRFRVKFYLTLHSGSLPLYSIKSGQSGADSDLSVAGIEAETGSNDQIVEIASESSVSYFEISIFNLTYTSFSIDDFSIWYSGSVSSSYTAMTTSEMPIYDNKFTFINLQRESASDSLSTDQIYNLDAKKYQYGSIFYAVSASLNVTGSQNIGWINRGDLIIGASQSSYATPFSGNIDEFRLWDTPIIENRINSHVKFPESYIGNTLTASFNDLLLRWNFNDPINVNNAVMLSRSFSNVAPSNGYTSSVSFYGWSEEDTFPYTYRLSEYEAEAHQINLGSYRESSNKVRIESTSLDGQLSPFDRREIGQYDDAILDSNKIGIYFSPTSLINEDIIKSLAIENAGDLIGNYQDLYSSSYSELDTLNKLYWNIAEQRTSISDYLKFINNYDVSLFENIRRLIPARCRPILGILYEPTILERPKSKYIKPTLSTHNYENSINIVIPSITSSYKDYTISKSLYEIISASSQDFNKYNIYAIVTASDVIGVSGSVADSAVPVVDFDTHVIYYELNHFKTPLSSSYSGSYQSKHYNRFLCFGKWEKRLKYEGCLNDEKTSYNQQPVVQVWSTNPNIIIAKDSGVSKLEIK